MKNYSHLIAKLFGPLLLHPTQHAAFLQLMEARLAGTSPETPQAAAPQKRFYPQGGYYREEADNEGLHFTDELRLVGSTAIIPVHGTLVKHPEDIAISECGCSMEELDAAIDKAETDPRVETMLFDFRTPGGTVTGIPETGRKMLYSRKKTIAFTGSQCCSGGLWLAEQCERFYATQSSRVGSCGVYCMTMDMSEALKKEGVKINAIFAGKFKLLGAYWKPLTEEERAILQAGVDKIRDQFHEAMVTQRGMSDEHFGNGLVFDGEEAAERGFTDGVVESMDEILDGLVE